MRGSAWRLYLDAGALATGGYHMLPEGPRAVLNVLVGASAVAAIALGVRWHRPARRLPWWLIAAAQGLFVARLHPSMAAMSEPPRRQVARLGRGRLLAMGAAALVAPALMTLQRLRGADIEVAAIAGAWAVLFVLVMARMAGLVRGIERSEVERRSLLDHSMQAAEQERIRIAAELHDGPIQRLSVLSHDLERAKQRVLTNPAAVAIGFDPMAGSELVRTGHFGLIAMRERVEPAGGRFQLESRPGAGVVVRATFALPSAA